MPPSRLHVHQDTFFLDTDLHIMGIGSEYPEHTCKARQFNEFALRHYPKTPAYVFF